MLLLLLCRCLGDVFVGIMELIHYGGVGELTGGGTGDQGDTGKDGRRHD